MGKYKWQVIETCKSRKQANTQSLVSHTENEQEFLGLSHRMSYWDTECQRKCCTISVELLRQPLSSLILDENACNKKVKMLRK